MPNSKPRTRRTLKNYNFWNYSDPNFSQMLRQPFLPVVSPTSPFTSITFANHAKAGHFPRAHEAIIASLHRGIIEQEQRDRKYFEWL